MNTTSFCCAILLLALSSCKRDALDNKQDGSIYLVEGKLSKYFGKQINFPKADNSWIWGRNSSEIFSRDINNLIRIDLSKDEVQQVSGLIALWGQNQENTGILFAGKIDGIEGQFLFNYATNKPECIQSFYYQNRLLLSRNTVAVAYFGSVPKPGMGCTAPWDFWCNGFVPQEKTLYIYTKNNPAPFAFKENGFEGFTKDGTRAVLTRGDNANWPMAFLFVDVQTGAITDSIPRKEFGPYFIDQIIRSISWNGNSRILTVSNASSGQVLKSFNLMSLVPIQTLWSSDGTKICLDAYDSVTGNYVLEILDINSGKETVVSTFPYDFFIGDMRLSNDNKRLLIHPGDKVNPFPNPPYYIKDIVY